MKLLITTLSALLFTAACSQYKHAAPKANQVPTSWYDSDSKNKNTNNEINPELARSVDAIFKANAAALDAGTADVKVALSPLRAAPTTPSGNKPKDWVPWRAEYFMTDLSLTGSGLIGVLAFKGTATVEAYWRKQGPAENKTKTMELTPDTEEKSNDLPVVMVQEDSTPELMVKQLEPVISAAVVTGKVKDTPEMRKNLLSAARDFHAIASSIPSNVNDLPWWVSRFRLDFTIDAAGRVEPVGMVGGEARFRFEWFRVAKSNSAKNPQPTTPSAPTNERQEKLVKSMKDLILAIALDLNEALVDQSAFGFKAHQMRLALGISFKGMLGLVKGAAGVSGHIYLSRDVKKPTIRPRIMNLIPQDVPLYIIERNPTKDHINFAKQNNLLFDANLDDTDNRFEEAVYKFSREKFRYGLQKTAEVGKFFAERAAKAESNSWKVYELKLGLDASISGVLDLITIAGTASGQMAFYNQNF